VAVISNISTRDLSEAELRDRQDDLEKALKLYKSVSSRLAEASPILELALADADRLRQMCEKNPVLRAAMVSRRLSVQTVIQDVRSVNFKATTVTKSVGKTLQAKRSELEEAVKDPELLR
jgi:hypothetical protein